MHARQKEVLQILQRHADIRAERAGEDHHELALQVHHNILPAHTVRAERAKAAAPHLIAIARAPVGIGIAGVVVDLLCARLADIVRRDDLLPFPRAFVGDQKSKARHIHGPHAQPHTAQGNALRTGVPPRALYANARKNPFLRQV